MRTCQIDLSDVQPYPHYDRERYIWACELGGSKLLILLAMNTHSDANGFCCPAIKTLEYLTKLSESTIKNCLKELRNDYQVIRQGVAFTPDGLQTSNDYVIDFSRLKAMAEARQELYSTESTEVQSKRDRKPKQESFPLKIAVTPTISIPLVVEPEVLVEPPVDKYRANFNARAQFARADYFSLWYALYSKALINAGRSPEKESVVHQEWLKRFPQPLPVRSIEGNLKPIFAAAKPELLEPIEEYVDRVKVACGEDAALFVLGDHWHQIRMIHSGLTGAKQKKYETSIGVPLGKPLVGIKGCIKYLESQDAESTYQWIEVIRSRESTIINQEDEELQKYFN